MAYVLGIDAAWSAHRPSGFSLVSCEPPSRPCLLIAARSAAEYLQSLDGGAPSWEQPPPNHPISLREVVEATHRKVEAWPLISLDIPLSHQPITERRQADQEVSHKYGACHAAAHTPNPKRPGKVSSHIYGTLTGLGYQLVTNGVCLAPNRPLFLETYPHPAVIELLGLQHRLQYKTSRRQNYWPHDTPTRRWEKLVESLTLLHDGLSGELELADKLPGPAFLPATSPKEATFKGYEDAIDATVCAWVGVEFLRDRCRPFGGADDTIWLPLPRRSPLPR